MLDKIIYWLAYNSYRISMVLLMVIAFLQFIGEKVYLTYISSVSFDYLFCVFLVIFLGAHIYRVSDDYIRNRRSSSNLRKSK